MLVSHLHSRVISSLSSSYLLTSSFAVLLVRNRVTCCMLVIHLHLLCGRYRNNMMCRSYARESPSFASGTISSLSSSYLYHTTCIMLHADSVESGTNSTGQKICTAMTPRVSPQGGALSSPRCLKRNIWYQYQHQATQDSLF